jgi:cytochrome c oxidase subunit IV
MSTQTESTHAAATHHGGPAIYTANLVALLILTGLTVGASYIDFGSANVVIALAIASVKASLVALFFMHLRWDKPVNAIIAIAGFLFLGIFLMFDFIDVGTRVDLQPHTVKEMEKPTPVPDSMNPLKTPAPRPLPAAPAPAGEGEGGEHK